MEYGVLTFRFSLVEAAPRCLAACATPIGSMALCFPIPRLKPRVNCTQPFQGFITTDSLYVSILAYNATIP